MQRSEKPTPQQLKKLYEKAIIFKEAQPWKWLYDADLICVENPQDKTIGYCSIMGKGGEHFALGVYLGAGGLQGLSQLLTGGVSLPYHQVLHLQDCLMCSFEDQEDLEDVDLMEMEELGLTFCGTNEWPKFRRFEPGYVPWFISQSECLFLTQALEQALHVAQEIKAGKLAIDIDQGKSLLRSLEEVDGQEVWHTEEIIIDKSVRKYPPLEASDELLLQNVKRAPKTGSTYQVDICYLPFPVRDDELERPFFPRIFVLADAHTGMILDYHIYQDEKDDVEISINRFVELVVNEGSPATLEVRNAKMFAIFTKLCEKVDIDLYINEELHVVDQVLEGMENHFQG